MEIKITTSNCEVISSGLITSFCGEPIKIILPDSKKTGYNITFEFIENKTTKEHNLTAKPQEDGITFFLTNFASPLGTGTIKPIQFAEDNTGRKMYVNFYVYSVGEANPTLHYTIYREIKGEDHVQ